MPRFGTPHVASKTRSASCRFIPVHVRRIDTDHAWQPLRQLHLQVKHPIHVPDAYAVRRHPDGGCVAAVTSTSHGNAARISPKFVALLVKSNQPGRPLRQIRSLPWKVVPAGHVPRQGATHGGASRAVRAGRVPAVALWHMGRPGVGGPAAAAR